jgi:hypothetical protein
VCWRSGAKNLKIGRLNAIQTQLFKLDRMQSQDQPVAVRQGSRVSAIRRSNSIACLAVYSLTWSATAFIRALSQPSGGRTTQNNTPLLGPVCLGAQT